MAQDNKSLGRFILDGIPPASRGIPQVEVMFDIDANGILNVTAKDKATSKTQSIRIEGSTGISKEEVDRMRKEAELHGQEDKKKQELIEAKNTADAIIYTAEKALRDAGDKVAEDTKKEVGGKVEALKKAKEGDSIEDIRKAADQLSQTLQKVGAEMYKAAGEQKQEEKKEDDEGKDVQEGKYKEKQ